MVFRDCPVCRLSPSGSAIVLRTPRHDVHSLPPFALCHSPCATHYPFPNVLPNLRLTQPWSRVSWGTDLAVIVMGERPPAEPARAEGGDSWTVKRFSANSVPEKLPRSRPTS